ncbi:hypothetical protein HJC23_008492 [Cyclotella cryptica]|uniref:Uncharacterized protein n=1 Tax=Cyclotella cryptica TaxID=29204 RepID=A0ABD3QWN1_9STRA|eukprot:CCRYP_001233-RB/>CCRYP_001233-RB protein AED:0.08 eAED:0.08 QI:98/-1/1/1/-1/1/1/200/286
MLKNIMRQLEVITALVIAASATTNAALEVIGSGYARTGTDTLRTALNELGYKTYHMKEIIQGKLLSDIHDWIALAENNCSDVEALKDLFERGGWTATVDFPSTMCWEALTRIYPDAKVIHSERKSEEEWWDSASNSVTIIHTKFPLNIMNRVLPFWRTKREMLNAIWSACAGKKVSDSDPGWPSVYKSDFLAAYSANNQRVRQVVPSERLLIQDHSKGWTLLADFLGKDVPNTPYPHRNTRVEFIRFAHRLSAMVILTAVVIIALAVFIIKKIGQVSVKGKTNKTE